MNVVEFYVGLFSLMFQGYCICIYVVAVVIADCFVCVVEVAF